MRVFLYSLEGRGNDAKTPQTTPPPTETPSSITLRYADIINHRIADHVTWSLRIAGNEAEESRIRNKTGPNWDVGFHSLPSHNGSIRK